MIGTDFPTPAIFIGLAVFGALLAYLYRWVARVSARL
jgi:hypothetical protein